MHCTPSILDLHIQLCAPMHVPGKWGLVHLLTAIHFSLSNCMHMPSTYVCVCPSICTDTHSHGWLALHPVDTYDDGAPERWRRHHDPATELLWHYLLPYLLLLLPFWPYHAVCPTGLPPRRHRRHSAVRARASSSGKLRPRERSTSQTTSLPHECW